uniref:Structural maintenance of chromosomes protein 6 n=1 Tax=Scleropages formosus TaxID=113540 RepID=A0A8C9SWB3_SCLFO
MSKRKNSSLSEGNHKRARSAQWEEDEEGDTGPSQASSVTYTSQKVWTFMFWESRWNSCCCTLEQSVNFNLIQSILFSFQTSGEVGIVESISLKNFMCHSLLGPFSFGSNVNFIVGNNGSGKSAVLTALIVGLGGKAHTTNRGSSLKGFVKEGESSADVSITLRNRGQDAYKPEVFGESIIVELRLSSEGLRTYKLKSKIGQLVSSKKDELVSILDHFNIQVDNPVSILTQEMSKHFLHSKGEGDKYKFFMKATQLEQMKEDYTYIMKTKNMTQNTVEKHEECLEDLKRKYLEKEDKYKSLASLDEMHAKLEELQNLMAWALVGYLLYLHYTLLLLEVVEAEKQYKQTHDQLDSISQRVQELQPQCSELRDEVQNRSKAFKEAEVTNTQCLNEQEERELHRSVEAKQRDLNAMVASRTDKIKRFGERMPALLETINEFHRKGHFRKKPVGPVGFCIRLKDPELALAVESCLKSLMLAFCCDNFKDEKTLQSIMSEHYPQGRRPLIIVSEFSSSMYNISGKAAQHPDYPTVLEALEVDNPVVANCLIDMRAVETVLVIKSNADARRVMQNGRPPVNCREAFTKEGDQVFPNRYYSCEYQRAQYLSKDLEEQIRWIPKHLCNGGGTLQLPLNSDSIIHGFVDFLIYTSKNPILTSLMLSITVSALQEEELQEICVRISDARQESDEARQKMNERRKAFEEAEQSYRQHKDIINNVAEEAERIKVGDCLHKCDQEVEKSKHHKKHYEEKRKTHINGIQKLKADLDVKEKELMASVAKASEICLERLEVKRTAKSIDSEISRLKQKISNQQDQQGDRDEVIRQYQEALENYRNIALQVKTLKKFIGLLGKIMNDRHKMYTEMRMYLSVRCKYYFDSMLSQRGYTGKMTFDHKNETLSISVQPGEGDKATLSDMRSLSGGERSFSTVCFVLSLWAIAEAPFRCLDEFDVYMDMVNRRISMDMMLKIAASQRYRQFIFLTPQSMSSLPVNNLIRILRLNDPDRGQTSLPFGRSNQEEAIYNK